ncbi:hypothetical protein G9A89_021687, partial [Geosiphon pyriformis]
MPISAGKLVEILIRFMAGEYPSVIGLHLYLSRSTTDMMPTIPHISNLPATPLEVVKIIHFHYHDRVFMAGEYPRDIGLHLYLSRSTTDMMPTISHISNLLATTLEVSKISHCFHSRKSNCNFNEFLMPIMAGKNPRVISLHWYLYTRTTDIIPVISHVSNLLATTLECNFNEFLMPIRAGKNPRVISLHWYLYTRTTDIIPVISHVSNLLATTLE